VSVFTAFKLAGLEGRVLKASARQWSFLVELFNGLATLKSAGVAERVLERWSGLFRQERMLGLETRRTELRSQAAIELASLLQSQALNVWCALAVLGGRLQMGEMLAFTMMAGAFHAAISGLGSLLTQFMLLKPQLETTRAMLEAEPEPPPRPSPGLFSPRLQVQALSFHYGPEAPWIFRNLDMDVAPGTKHRIPGPSGAGKSTLLRLLAGLLTPDEGQVLLGGMAPSDARPHRVYLPQGVRLFQGSLLDNLRLYSGGADRSRMMAAAAATGLANLVESLPMGWDTWVCLGGGNFSGGQRQLVALTGVLASDRPLLLLDEAMANLDAIHQAALLSNPMFDGKTIIYASHASAFKPP
jgi:ABC-type bacteriocin/lantibiotic exporter with double-glycine peptidase domain